MSAGQFLLAVLLVGIGGGLGSVVRWGVRELSTRVAASRDSVRAEQIRPWTTFVVNILACFVLGTVVARLGSATGSGELVYLTLAVGFCGGLSTLSTAALDIVELVRRGTFSVALAYLMLSTGSGMAALWLGLVLVS
ncbi:fluoride efflux transporter FluC [Brachybacterium sp. AOP43-C2-M15]|uniref:fluoride efflux transporter FluC n=1 Tax=Brachybacterium sp. AOP43-C2-M15 TaxID=3457661 RepID=UPI004033639D